MKFTPEYCVSHKIEMDMEKQATDFFFDFLKIWSILIFVHAWLGKKIN